jgi:hypothetical protein
MVKQICIGRRLVYTIQYVFSGNRRSTQHAYNGNGLSTAIQFSMRIMEIGGRLVYTIHYAYNGNRRSTVIIYTIQ